MNINEDAARLADVLATRGHRVEVVDIRTLMTNHSTLNPIAITGIPAEPFEAAQPHESAVETRVQAITELLHLLYAREKNTSAEAPGTIHDVVRSVYADVGMANDNASIIDPSTGGVKPMPTVLDLYVALRRAHKEAVEVYIVDRMMQALQELLSAYDCTGLPRQTPGVGTPVQAKFF